MKILHSPPLEIQPEEEADIQQGDEARLVMIDGGLAGEFYERDAFFFEAVGAFFNQAFEHGKGIAMNGKGSNQGARQLQAIVDHSTAVIYVKDVDGKYVLVNRAFEEIFRLSRRQIIGKTAFDIFPEAVARRLRENDEKVLATGNPIEVKEVVVQPRGRRTYMSVKFPLKDAGGCIYAEVGISTDITDRTHSNECRRHLAAIVDSSQDGIISRDIDGIITTWNKGAERIYGYTADEIIGKPVSVLVPPDHQDQDTEFLRKDKPCNQYETIQRRKDGKNVEVSVTVSPIKDEMGRIIGASKIARDITSQKHLELQQKCLYELATTVNRAPALPEIYEAALNTICRCQNTDRAAILLRDPGGVLRFKAWRHLSDEYRTIAEKLMEARREERCNFELIYVPDVSKVESEEYLRTLMTREGIQAIAMLPITYENRPLGRFTVYYNTPHDFTREEMFSAQTITSQVAFAIEREERMAALREAVEQMEEFSYSISHDLRAPIRAMQGYASVLKQDCGPQLDENAKEYLDRIIQSSERADRLIHDTLIYTRVSRRELQLSPVSLEKLTREIVQQELSLRPTRAQITIESPLLSVLAHEPTLMQAISNLLSNAIKFVAPGVTPQVHLRTETRDRNVRLWVEDNGIGVKPEYHHKLFGMFERIEAKENYEGTGIGLAIVRKAVERMGGNVGIESDGVHGSKFWIQLPAAANP